MQLIRAWYSILSPVRGGTRAESEEEDRGEDFRKGRGAGFAVVRHRLPLLGKTTMGNGVEVVWGGGEGGHACYAVLRARK